MLRIVFADCDRGWVDVSKVKCIYVVDDHLTVGQGRVLKLQCQLTPAIRERFRFFLKRFTIISCLSQAVAKRAAWVAKVMVVMEDDPVPVATGPPQLTPSLETMT